MLEPVGTAEGDINLSSRRAQWQVSNLSAETFETLQEDSDAFLHQSLSTPCLNALRSAKGAYIEDVQGRQYLDFHGNSVHQVGYGHPKVIQAIKDQLDTLPFCPRRYTNDAAIELAQRLGTLAPGNLNKVLFAPGGTAAIGIALKLARVATGRFKTVSMWDSFHGASLDAVSVGGEDLFRKDIGPLMPGTEHVPPADPRRCPLQCRGTCNLTCASYLEYVLEKEGDVCAVIAEPVRCTTVAPPPAGYWKRIREACDRRGTLLIFDEIPTCLGRTGAMFATEWTGVVPDMIVIGKGLGGAVFPMAAVIAREDLDVAKHIALGHYTHEKSSVGCAAAVATLDVIQEENLVERAHRLGIQYVKALEAMATKRASVVAVRGLGFQVAVELSDPSEAERVMYYCLEHGMSFKVSSGTILTLAPALVISEEDLMRTVEILDAALSAS